MKRFFRLAALAVCTVLIALSRPVPAIAAPAAQQEDTRPDYTICVNRAWNCVTVYTTDEQGELVPVKAMICSCGRKGHGTPVGTYQTSDYYEWRWMFDNSVARYAVRFNGYVLFHSVPYTRMSPDALEWDQYNLLGEVASMGCVRLSVADSKWIYENCKPGTKVVIYLDEESPGPLGKPEAVVIDPDDPRRGWDPTDDDENNPWLAQKPAVGSSDTAKDATASGAPSAESTGTVKVGRIFRDSAASEKAQDSSKKTLPR